MAQRQRKGDPKEIDRQGEADNRNQEIAEKLEEGGPEFPRNIAYRMAAGKVASHPDPIESGKDAQKNVEGIGRTMAGKIDEILETGHLKETNQGDGGQGKQGGGQGRGGRYGEDQD